MKRKALSGFIVVLLVLVLQDITQANIITYNFGGKLTSVTDPTLLIKQDRNIQVGDIFQAIYTIDADTPLTSGTIGGGPMKDSSFLNAILNFQFYVNNINFVNSNYRIQSLRNINGSINGRPADWIEIITDGGIDNYSNAYGENSYKEFIDSYLVLVDLTGTALDKYNKTFTGNIPLSFDMNNFTFGYISIMGQSSINLSSLPYQLRGDITSFSNKDFQPVSEPAIMLLFVTSIAGIVTIRSSRKK